MAPTGKPDPSPRRFAGLGFQMLAVIALAAWAGSRLDAFLELTFPVFTMSLVFIGFAGSLISIWYQINR